MRTGTAGRQPANRHTHDKKVNLNFLLICLHTRYGVLLARTVIVHSAMPESSETFVRGGRAWSFVVVRLLDRPQCGCHSVSETDSD